MNDRSSLTTVVNVVKSCTNKGDNERLYRVVNDMASIKEHRHMISGFNVLRDSNIRMSEFIPTINEHLTIGEYVYSGKIFAVVNLSLYLHA